MKRTWTFLAVAVVALAGTAAPAHAIPPDRYSKEVFSPEITVLDGDLTAECGFNVYATTKGQLRLTAFFDKDGALRGIQGHPSMATTYSSEWASIETADRGVDKLSLSDDGNLLIFGTGIHLKVKGQAYAIGLWRLTVDLATGDLISQEYSGNFDVDAEGIATYLCAALDDPELP
jgi:hypothetical protein